MPDKVDDAGRSLNGSPGDTRRWRKDELGATVGVVFCGSDVRLALCNARARALTFFLPVCHGQSTIITIIITTFEETIPR